MAYRYEPRRRWLGVQIHPGLVGVRRVTMTVYRNLRSCSGVRLVVRSLHQLRPARFTGASDGDKHTFRSTYSFGDADCRLGCGECVPGELTVPGDLPAGEYITQNFFGGQLTVTLPADWTSFEDSTGEFALRPVGTEGFALLFWLDVYPIVDPGSTPVADVERTAEERARLDRSEPEPGRRAEHRDSGAYLGRRSSSTRQPVPRTSIRGVRRALVRALACSASRNGGMSFSAKVGRSTSD